MLQRRLLRSLCGWRITTPCIRIRGWATAHRGNTSSLVLNPPRVRSNGGNSIPLQRRERHMTKLTKRTVDAADIRETDYFIWDDDLPGFGLRVFASGKRSYLIQYRAAGRTRRYTIGLHGVWTPETARQEAKVQFGRVARG